MSGISPFLGFSLPERDLPHQGQWIQGFLKKYDPNESPSSLHLSQVQGVIWIPPPSFRQGCIEEEGFRHLSGLENARMERIPTREFRR